MKNTLFVSLLLATGIMLTSCDNMTISNDDSATKINGNGTVQSQTRPVSSFNQIAIEGVFNVILSENEQESVKVETDENIQPLIITSVENNTLSVKMRDSTSIGKVKKINIYISVNHLSKLSTTGVGKLACQNKLMVDKLDLDFSGVGLTELKLDGNQLNVKSEIVGALVLEGSVKEVKINHSGLGIIQAFELKSEKLSLDADGIGAAEVYATKELNVNAKGVGGVKYRGNPEKTNVKNEGIGKVEREDI